MSERWSDLRDALLILITYPIYVVLGIINIVGMAFFAIVDPRPGKTFEEWSRGNYD